MPGVKFAWVLDVARWVRDELEKLNIKGFPKTSGASGIHIFIPLAPGTPYEAGQIFCQIVATVVSNKHPKVATVTRSVHARGQKVYVDYLQNIEGKSLACAYSARASDFAGASTPLTWKEIDEGLRYARFHHPHAAQSACAGWRSLATAAHLERRRPPEVRQPLVLRNLHQARELVRARRQPARRPRPGEPRRVPG